MRTSMFDIVQEFIIENRYFDVNRFEIFLYILNSLEQEYVKALFKLLIELNRKCSVIACKCSLPNDCI